MLNILGKRYIFFAISLLIIIPGMILTLMGLPLAIDFTGGTLLEAQFESGKAPLPGEIITLLQENNIEDVQVQPVGEDIVNIRAAFMDEATRSTIVSTLEQHFNDQVSVLRFESVGPTIGREVASRAALAVAVAALVVVVYVTYAFRGIPHAFRYGVCAIIAMIHDVAIVVSLAAIGGRLFGWQVDALFLTALLTVIGFSVQDKIVVFDRIRENSNIYRRLPFETLVNHSIVQTLQRSINTQLMTVEFMLLALALFGGITLREFAVILLVGLFSGTYSSIFIAAPILVLWENREWRYWFGRGKKEATV
ncbi:MAG: protein translocase subunit SecF [Chloroflexota bacterium]|nr:MAG: protein translocase subunit SecF [Chloroflexota bacterium]